MYLIIDILATVKLSFSPEHPFIGDDIKFTCNSVIHSCPGKRPSNLSFKYFGNKRGDTDKNTLTIQALAKSDKGMNISCQATDDLGIVFYLSETVTLDPYYSPDKIVLEPADTIVNVREGNILGPIHCTTTCNPECTYQWKYNVTGRFELVPIKLVPNQGRTLTVPQIKRSQTGTFRCHVEYNVSHIKKTADFSINVQYGPDKVVLDPGSTSINVPENSTLGPIYCTAACNPPCTYQWKHNGTGRFEQVKKSLLSFNNQTLTVPHIKRSQNGIYRCHVDDYQYHTYKISDIAINVQYGPDRVILEPASSYINVKEGDTLGPIHCTATCNPQCTYQWEYNVTGRFKLVPFELVSTQGRTLTVPQIQRSQAGIYRCHVDNYFTQIKMTAEVSITVQCMYYLCNIINEA
ncbi:carcinoembryonic antigen-related cell adhesion molecule [Mytilus galloprovincialis]|uniref:Carcinoembryonic antigen-related cell adhesion molecule n=1 Tax=Mytilus galloprovincialis TaxID=29158 RepID=A0A8B6HC43_MYTGA|nr:carcinoembryonic antigen-related cell adhesion molecule [Mytilus galloprovincialis]